MKTAKPATRARRQASSPGRRARLDLTVQHASRARNVPPAADFEQWVRAALREDACITLRIVGENEGRALNRDYRGRNYATNVLTFVLDEGPPRAGDLALCAAVVSREARAQGKAVKAHYAHLTVHGILHLQGFDHESEPDALAMEKLETRILRRLGFPDPYQLHSEDGRHTQ